MQTLDYIPRNIFSRTRHPPKDVRIYTLEGPEFLLINLISRKNIFRPLHQSPRNLIIPDKIACFRKHTSKDLSAHTTPSSPSPRRMTSLIKIPISEKEIFNVSPLGTGVNDLSSLRTIPPQSWRIVSRDHHPKATHRFQLPRWRLELLHCGKKKKQIVPPYLSLVYKRRTVYLSRISHGSGLPAFMRRGTKVLAHERKPARCCCWREQERGRWKGKRETEKEENKKGGKIGDRILLFGRRGHAWFEVCTLSWCIRTLLKTRGRRIKKKKKYSFVSAHCLPRFMIVGSVTDEISMPMEARPIFHIEIPLLVYNQAA